MGQPGKLAPGKEANYAHAHRSSTRKDAVAGAKIDITEKKKKKTNRSARGALSAKRQLSAAEQFRRMGETRHCQIDENTAARYKCRETCIGNQVSGSLKDGPVRRIPVGPISTTGTDNLVLAKKLAQRTVRAPGCTCSQPSVSVHSCVLGHRHGVTGAGASGAGCPTITTPKLVIYGRVARLLQRLRNYERQHHRRMPAKQGPGRATCRSTILPAPPPRRSAKAQVGTLAPEQAHDGDAEFSHGPGRSPTRPRQRPGEHSTGRQMIEFCLLTGNPVGRDDVRQ